MSEDCDKTFTGKFKHFLRKKICIMEIKYICFELFVK